MSTKEKPPVLLDWGVGSVGLAADFALFDGLVENLFERLLLAVLSIELVGSGDDQNGAQAGLRALNGSNDLCPLRCQRLRGASVDRLEDHRGERDVHRGGGDYGCNRGGVLAKILPPGLLHEEVYLCHRIAYVDIDVHHPFSVFVEQPFYYVKFVLICQHVTIEL